MIMTGSVVMSTPKRLFHFWILVRVRCVNVCTCYVPDIIHALRRYNDRSCSMIFVRIVVLQISATSYFCLLPQQYVCLHRTETRACSRCVVVYRYPRFFFNEAFCKFPFGFSRGVFFHLQGIQFFLSILFFNQLTLDLCETNKNDSTSDIYV